VRIVLDTNVIVSALLVQGSVPDRVLELVTTNRCTLLVDSRIAVEYREVLERPAFKFSRSQLELFFAMVDRAERVSPDPMSLSLPDPTDEPFLEVAVAGGADALVTGNAKHFAVRGGGILIPVVTPRRFLDLLAGR